MGKFEQIIFDNEYPKLKGERYGVLAAVITKIPAELLKTKWRSLLDYDTIRSDWKFFGIQDGIYYILLLFIGENGNLIPTLRKSTPENEERYALLVGSPFEFIIIEEK